MTYIGNNDYSSDTLLNDASWSTSIANSTYFDKVLKPLIPTMTSNTSSNGVASSTRYFSDRYPWKAFDGDDNTFFEIAYTQGQIGDYLQYTFNSPVQLRAYSFYSYGLGVSGTVTLNIIGIKEDNTEITLDTIQLPNSPVTVFKLTSFETIKAIKVVMASTTQYNQMTVSTLQFYGRQ